MQVPTRDYLRVFKIFQWFSTHFNLLNLSQPFSWVYGQYQFIFQSKIHVSSCVPKIFSLGTIHQGQSFVTGGIKKYLTLNFTRAENHHSLGVDVFHFLTKKASQRNQYSFSTGGKKTLKEFLQFLNTTFSENTFPANFCSQLIHLIYI